jgi:POT family proton-dependent oligopeptide transporter
MHLAVETPLFLYIRWILMVGNGLFKPNMTSIISYAYESILRKRWSLFSLLYGCMQVPSWELCFAVTLVKKFPELGFGLAGIFMFLGMLQFYFTQDIFGSIGLKPSAESKQASKAKQQLKIHHQMLFVTVLLPFNFLCLYRILLGCV